MDDELVLTLKALLTPLNSWADLLVLVWPPCDTNTSSLSLGHACPIDQPKCKKFAEIVSLV